MALYNHFWLAYVLFSLTTIWAEALWLTSNQLENARVRRDKPIAKQRKYTVEEIEQIRHKKNRDFQMLKWGIFVLFACIGIVCILGTARQKYIWELSLLNGVLYPANDPDVPNVCSGQSGDFLKVSFGGGGMGATTSEDHLWLVTKQKNDSLQKDVVLGIERLQNGNVSVIAHVIGQDGKTILDIDPTHFAINRNEILDDLSPPRTDLSTIELRDGYDNKLKVRLINNHMVLFVGKLYLTPGEYIEANKSGVSFNGGGSLLTSSCFSVEIPDGGGLFNFKE